MRHMIWFSYQKIFVANISQTKSFSEKLIKAKVAEPKKVLMKNLSHRVIEVICKEQII